MIHKTTSLSKWVQGQTAFLVLLHLTIGFVASAASLDVVFPALCVSVVLGALLSGRDRRISGALIGFLVCAGAIVVSCLLPMKALDRKVGPFAYRDISVRELCWKLFSEQGIPVRLVDVSPGSVHDDPVEFVVAREVSKREVIEQLCRAHNLQFVEGYCGTGASALFGGAPSFCHTRPKLHAGDGIYYLDNPRHADARRGTDVAGFSRPGN